MELIKIYNGSLINARELHSFLGSKQRFSDWIKNRIKKYEFVENRDFFTNHKIMIRENSAKQGASKSKEYYITINMAKELAMVENNDKGREARKYFIKAEESLQTLKQKTQNKRLEAFLKLETTKERLHKNVLNLGGTQTHYIQIDTEGSKILFNGEVIHDEELGLLALKGRDFATELTNDILKEGNHLLEDVEEINKEQHRTIRQVIIENTNRKPEELPKGERIKKLGE